MSERAVTLTEFLLVRVAEDEQSAARLADKFDSGALLVTASLVHAGALVDPARVSAECEARRAIIEWCAEVIGERDLTGYGQFGILKDDPGALAVTLAMETLLNFARVHANHPDFDAWRAPK